MAASVAARRLTEAHRLAQARLGAETVAAMRAIWRLLDPDDLDGTFEQWLATASPIIRQNNARSGRLSANYLRTFKMLELGQGVSSVPVVLAPVEPEAVATSLLVTGPVSIKRAMVRGVLLDKAVETAEAASAASAMRHVLDGGRGTILNTFESDRQMIGYARATSGSPCAFCAMVASRGPVYKSASSATSVVGRQAYAAETRYQQETRRGGNLSRQGSGESKIRERGSRKLGASFHDGCNCTAEPVYRDDADWPAGSRRFREIYDKAAEGTYGSGETQLQRFRKALEQGD